MEQSHPQQDVLDAIKSGKAKMRPRWFFILRTVLVIAITVFIMLMLLYVMSFIIFALHQSGAWNAVDFGVTGWTVFLEALPWGLLLLSLILLVLLANLLKRYAFVYHRPLFYLLFGLLMIMIVGSFVLAATSFHLGISRYATQNLPIVGSFYQFETAAPPAIHRGVIIAVGTNGFIIQNPSGISSTVIAAPGVVLVGTFALGDKVMVFGSRQSNGTIEAFGIEEDNE